MNNIQILGLSGFIPLQVWQANEGIESDQIGRFFNISEFPKRFVIAAPLIKLLDLYREKTKEPCYLNSTYRTMQEQNRLRKEGYRAAKTSPHLWGMGADVETETEEETLIKVKILKECAAELGIKIRLGYKKYLKAGQTFIHVDVCPMFFGKFEGSGHFNIFPHPWQWEKEVEW